MLSHGSQTEKNFLSFRIIDSKRRSRVNYEEFKEFWLLFIELCSSIFNLAIPKLEDENLKILFNDISVGYDEFDFI